VAGRPLVNFSLAINHALGGQSVAGYHAFNLAVHLLAALTLFGLVRRTLLRPVLRGRFGTVALPVAFSIALLWTIHPLQTEAVTNVAYRTELFVGLFYLLTLHCFARGVESPTPGRWQLVAVLACLCGMASKEVMVSAPLMVLLYDRTFVAGTFREAWRLHRRLYCGLAATWLLLGYLVAGMGAARGVSAGFGLGITWWNYALTQSQAIVHYLRLAVWPAPLIFDYGISVVSQAKDVAPQLFVVLLLAAGTAIALRRRPVLGFIGAWFFAILAPSSSVVPIVTQTMAERRMYLPLAAVVTLGVAGLFILLGRRTVVVWLAVAIGLAGLTVKRNATFRSEESVWIETIAHRPQNARAYNNLGSVLSDRGRIPEAIENFETALRLEPNYTYAQMNLGAALGKIGRPQEAIPHFEAALRLEPHHPEARTNLGSALLVLGRNKEAVRQLEQAVAEFPHSAEAHAVFALALNARGEAAAAIRELEAALKINPGQLATRYNLATILLEHGRAQDAIPHLVQVIRLKPEFADAHYNLALALQRLGRVPEAIEHYEEALRLNPSFTDARQHLLQLHALRPPNSPAAP